MRRSERTLALSEKTGTPFSICSAHVGASRTISRAAPVSAVANGAVGKSSRRSSASYDLKGDLALFLRGVIAIAAAGDHPAGTCLATPFTAFAPSGVDDSLALQGDEVGSPCGDEKECHQEHRQEPDTFHRRIFLNRRGSDSKSDAMQAITAWAPCGAAARQPVSSKGAHSANGTSGWPPALRPSG